MNYDIAALKRKMLVKYPFFGSVVANVKYKETKEIETAETDGKTIYYNPDFLESLNVEQQTFTFAHEVCHIAFNHILRSEGKNQKIWNIATDAVINQFLMRDGLEKIKGIVDMPEAINYDAEQLYEKLLKEQQEKQQEQNNNQQQSQGQSDDSQNQEQNQDNQQEKEQDVGHDTHGMWKDAVNEHNKEKKEKDNSDSKNEKKQENQEKSELEKKQEELENMGEKGAFKKNHDEKKELLEKLKESISKQASQAGNTTDSNIRTIDNIGNSKPIVDWRYVLRESINYDVDWSYKDASIEDGILSANLQEQPMPETEIVLDTSGSIDETLLRNFLRECKNILQHTKLKVGCFDTRFYGFHDIKNEEDIDNMQFVGGGGTNFDVAVGAFSRRVENKIIFTDGEAAMPDTSLNAIWIVFGGRRIEPKGGRVIYISPEQYDKLQNLDVNYETSSKSLR